MKKNIAVSVFVSLAFMIALSGIAFAQPSTIVNLPTNITTAADVFTAIRTVTNWIFTIMLIASVIIVLLAGFQFVTAGDNEKSVTAARQKIMYAAVGIIIALLARALPVILQNIIG